MFSYPDLGGADKVRFGLKGHARPQMVIKEPFYMEGQLNLSNASITLKGKDDEHKSESWVVFWP